MKVHFKKKFLSVFFMAALPFGMVHASVKEQRIPIAEDPVCQEYIRNLNDGGLMEAIGAVEQYTKGQISCYRSYQDNGVDGGFRHMARSGFFV